MKGSQKPLTQWQTLRDYIACMHDTVGVWSAFFDSFQPQWFPPEEISSWIERINHSLQVLESRYMYDPLELLSIDPLASGFPQRYSMRILEHERERIVRDKAVPKVTSQSLRKAFLDHLFMNNEANAALLEQIGKTTAQELLPEAETLNLFRLRSLSKVSAKNGKKAYVCCWERYGYRNVPTLYAMLFECSSKSLTKKDQSDLSLILREETTQMPLLERLGRNIDYAMANVHPKWIGRIILGPVFVSHVTQDKNPLQKTLDKIFPKGEKYGAASRVIYEYVMSEREDPVEKLSDPRGRRHKVIQVFGVRESDDECYRRRITNIEKTLFAPHAVIQMLDDAYRKEIDHQLIGV